MKMNICIIGCGPRGIVHAHAWQKIEGARILAVCDLQEDRRTSLAQETGATAYVDWRKALDHPEITVVSQALPTCLHAPVTIAAAAKGFHVFGEKPLALTVAEGEQMLSAIDKAGVVFMPCFQYRNEFVYQEYRRAFRSGELGSPVAMQFTDVREVRPKTDMHRRSRNGGVVIDMACHIFDLMRWITGEEPERIFATGHIFGRGKARLAEFEDLAVDEAAIHLSMAGGHHLQMYLNWGMPEGFGGFPNGHWLTGPLASMRPLDGGVERIGGSATDTQVSKNESDSGTSASDSRIRAFADTVRRKTTADVTGTDGLVALRLSYAALESLEKGKAITL